MIEYIIQYKNKRKRKFSLYCMVRIFHFENTTIDYIYIYLYILAIKNFTNRKKTYFLSFYNIE